MILFTFLFFTAFAFDTISTSYRAKRYVAFPEGATMSMSFSLAIPTLSVLPMTFGESIVWGMAYELPNASYIHSFDSKYVAHRRHRRHVYNKMEILMDSMGLDGRSCILRALCESEQILPQEGENIIEELIRIVFRFPLENVQDSEPEMHRLYHWARRIGRMSKDCMQLFSSCPVSLIDLALIPLYSNSDSN